MASYLAAVKAELVKLQEDQRFDATDLEFVEFMAKLDDPPSALVCAEAIQHYRKNNMKPSLAMQAVVATGLLAGAEGNAMELMRQSAITA